MILGRTISRGSESVVNSMASSSTRESTLPDNWGRSDISRSGGISLGRVAVVSGLVVVLVSVAGSGGVEEA